MSILPGGGDRTRLDNLIGFCPPVLHVMCDADIFTIALGIRARHKAWEEGNGLICAVLSLPNGLVSLVDFPLGCCRLAS